MSILLYRCTTWTLSKRMQKKLDDDNARMLCAIMNKSWRQNTTKQQLFGHLPPIIKTIQVRRTRHAGHCCRSKDELISDILLWTPSHGRAKVGWPARTYIQQFCADTGCRFEAISGGMVDRDEWWGRVREIRVSSVTLLLLLVLSLSLLYEKYFVLVSTLLCFLLLFHFIYFIV